MEPRVAALLVSHTKKNWSCHMFIEIHAHISKKIPKIVHFGAIMALLKIGRWYHPPIGMQTIKHTNCREHKKTLALNVAHFLA